MDKWYRVWVEVNRFDLRVYTAYEMNPEEEPDYKKKGEIADFTAED